MDPASIIGLTGNLVQVLTYGYEIVSGAREIYKLELGGTDNITRIRFIDLDVVSCDLSQDIAHLKLIAEECEKAAEGILSENIENPVPKDRLGAHV
ncbi:hypothetical protein PG996_014467 [Apiospora saccharicola]|uniref:Uncharacterized protein n=1 Tax=Apiospora saccharicola TaxID=335842 RepID=A0ABR1TIE6_9PEZI